MDFVSQKEGNRLILVAKVNYLSLKVYSRAPKQICMCVYMYVCVGPASPTNHPICWSQKTEKSHSSNQKHIRVADFRQPQLCEDLECATKCWNFPCRTFLTAQMSVFTVFCGPHLPLAFQFVCGPGEGKWKVSFCLASPPQVAAEYGINSSFC